MKKTAFESYTAYAEEKAKAREEAADATVSAIRRAKSNPARRGNSLVACPSSVRVLPHARGAIVTVEVPANQAEADQMAEAAKAGKLWLVAEVS